jgi:hypothetical protein
LDRDGVLSHHYVFVDLSARQVAEHKRITRYSDFALEPVFCLGCVVHLECHSCLFWTLPIETSREKGKRSQGCYRGNVGWILFAPPGQLLSDISLQSLEILFNFLGYRYEPDGVHSAVAAAVFAVGTIAGPKFTAGIDGRNQQKSP